MHWIVISGNISKRQHISFSKCPFDCECISSFKSLDGFISNFGHFLFFIVILGSIQRGLLAVKRSF